MCVQNLRQIYDQRAIEYCYHESQGFPARKHRGILACLPELHGVRWLEVGCGDGPYLTWGSQREPVVCVGVDISSRILEQARERVRHEGQPERVCLSTADAVALPFADTSFDIVLASQVIEHVPDDAAALYEMRRVLRFGGTLVISTDHRDNRVTQGLTWPAHVLRRALGRLDYHPPFLHRSYGLDEFTALLHQAGFEVHESATFRFSWPTSLARAGGLVRILDVFEERLTRHAPWNRWGDIILLVATRSF